MMDMPDTSFRAFVSEIENDPEQKAALAAAREMLRDDDPPTSGVREPRRPTPDAPATSEAVVTARDYDHLDRVVADLHEQIRGLKADRQRPFLTLLREFLWSDEARDVTGSWGHDNKSGDEFRNELMEAAVAAALPTKRRDEEGS